MKRFFMRWRHWLLLGACLAALAGYIAFTLEREYRNTAALETERLSAQSKVVEDNLRRQLTTINLMIEWIVAELPSCRAGKGARTAAARACNISRV